MSHLTHAAVSAAGSNRVNGPGFFNSDNFTALLLLIAGLVIVYVGIMMAGKSNKGRFKDQADTFGSVTLAVVVIAMGATMAFVGFGEKLLTFVGIG